MARKRRALDDHQKAVLDAAFLAQLDEDLLELERLLNLLEPKDRPKACPTTLPQLAKLVAEKLSMSVDGVKNRFYNNGLQKSLAPRQRFMKGVESVLREQYESVGSSFARDYQIFVNPVEGEEDDVAGASTTGPLGTTFAQWSQIRIGAWLAEVPEPAHVDNVHHYDEVFRQDFLDYNTPDFYSIRRLKGRNVGHRASSFLLYRESSERKFTFADAGVTALNVPTKEELVVDPDLGFGTLAHTHAFRIHFPKPIEPGETFDIVYNIRLPGELLDLNRDSEVMSISLSRIKHGVDKLVFNVALSFQPRAAVAYRLTRDEQFVLCAGTPPRVTKYKAQEWFEKPNHLGIEWSVATPYIIQWATTSPNGRMYIINFRGDDRNSPLSPKG